MCVIRYKVKEFLKSIKGIRSTPNPTTHKCPLSHCNILVHVLQNFRYAYIQKHRAEGEDILIPPHSSLKPVSSSK